MRRRQHALCGVGLISLMGLLYGPHALTATFVYEDAVWQAWAAHGGVPRIGPRIWMQLAWWLTDSPQIHHVLSLGLFVSLGALIGLFASRLGLSAPAAWTATALFLLAPVMSETAAYAASAPELWAAIGVVGACIISLRETHWRWFLIPTAILFGIGGKESALIGCAFVPLTLWATGRLSGTRLMQGAVALGLLTFTLVDLKAVANMGEAVGLQVSGWDWLLTQSAAAYWLLGVSLSGVGMTIDADLDILTQTAKALALSALLLTAIIAWMLRTSRPLVAFGLAWCLVSIAPRLLVQTPRSYMNAHQFTVPFIGLALAGAAGLDRGRA